MKEVPIHLLLSYDENIPNDFIEPFVHMISTSGLALKVEPRPPLGPQFGLAWFLPSVVLIYISKSYFDGFLKEAGKQHCVQLQKAIGCWWSSLFGTSRVINTQLIATLGKAPTNDIYSYNFSLMAEAHGGLRFKLLFPDQIRAEEFNLAVAAFLKFLANYYEGDLDRSTQARLTRSRAIGGTILLAFHKDADYFIFLDPTARENPRER